VAKEPTHFFMAGHFPQTGRKTMGAFVKYDLLNKGDTAPLRLGLGTLHLIMSEILCLEQSLIIPARYRILLIGYS